MQVENVVIDVSFPKCVINAILTPSQGKYTFDLVSKMMTWDVGKVDSSKLASIKGNVCNVSTGVAINVINILRMAHMTLIISHVSRESRVWIAGSI